MKDTLLVLGIAFAVILGGLALLKPTPLPPVGSVPGPQLDSNYFAIGGVEYWHGKRAIAATSTALCVFKNPWSATSTLERASLVPFTNGTLATQSLDFSTTTQAAGNSTSSPALAANFQIPVVPLFPFIWNISSTTDSKTIGVASNAGFGYASNNVFFRSGENITFRIATNTPGTFANGITGTCEATFRKL